MLNNEIGTSLQITESSPMRRLMNWKDVFWIASGASTLGLFSIGSIAATIGTPSWIIWLVSSAIGFLQLFIYAEIAGIFPNKSGGASVYGAVAWIRYGKVFAPINIWSYWIAWSPALAIGASLAGSYIVTAFFSDTAFGKFSVTLLDLSAFLPDIKLTLNAPILIGVIILALNFYIQHTGILRTVKTQFILALLSLIPIVALGVVPLISNKVDFSNFTPLIPLGTNSWFSFKAFTLVMGSMFIAAWSTYAAEMAVCYTSELKNPAKDNFIAIISVGVLAFFCFTLLPFTFLGVLGIKPLIDPAFANGDPQAAVIKLAQITFGTGSGNILSLMLIFALILSITTVMSGGSRTLYQASLDGILPKFLSKLNSHGTPANAMWCDLVFNIFLLSLGKPIFVLAASSVAYVLCISMDMNAAWMHRQDRPNVYRPYRAPNWMVYFVGPILSILNIAFIIFGANVFAPNALWYGLAEIVLVIPIFWYRHYLVDGGVWPVEARKHLQIQKRN